MALEVYELNWAKHYFVTGIGLSDTNILKDIPEDVIKRLYQQKYVQPICEALGISEYDNKVFQTVYQKFQQLDDMKDWFYLVPYFPDCIDEESKLPNNTAKDATNVLINTIRYNTHTCYATYGYDCTDVIRHFFNDEDDLMDIVSPGALLWDTSNPKAGQRHMFRFPEHVVTQEGNSYFNSIKDIKPLSLSDADRKLIYDLYHDNMFPDSVAEKLPHESCYWHDYNFTQAVMQADALDYGIIAPNAAMRCMLALPSYCTQYSRTLLEGLCLFVASTNKIEAFEPEVIEWIRSNYKHFTSDFYCEPFDPIELYKDRAVAAREGKPLPALNIVQEPTKSSNTTLGNVYEMSKDPIYGSEMRDTTADNTSAITLDDLKKILGQAVDAKMIGTANTVMELLYNVKKPIVDPEKEAIDYIKAHKDDVAIKNLIAELAPAPTPVVTEVQEEVITSNVQLKEKDINSNDIIYKACTYLLQQMRTYANQHPDAQLGSELYQGGQALQTLSTMSITNNADALKWLGIVISSSNGRLREMLEETSHLIDSIRKDT